MAATSQALDEALIQELETAFRGELVRPADPAYDPGRTVWNAMISRRPALIARCRGTADVIACVNLAGARGIPISVRGGGHSVAGHAVSDGALMIDLSLMKGMRVDPQRRTVRAEPGLTWGEFDRETQAFGLATTGGAVSTTGIAGLTVGGGLGYLMRRFGLACDNLLSADIVTAQGELLTASATQNEDLFWGIRGGGGNFGIVTSFELQLHSLGPTILAGLIVHPLAAAADAMRFYRDFAAAAPDELTTHAGFVTAPDGTPVLAFAVCWTGPLAQGEAVVRPLRDFGSPLDDTVGPTLYTALQTEDDAAYPPGRHNYWKSSFLHGVRDGAVETLIRHFQASPSPFNAVLLEQMGGAVSRVGSDETAFNDRGATHSLVIAAAWTDPATSTDNIRWTRDLWEAMQPFQSERAYVNYLGEEDEDRVKGAYGVEKYGRLVALKNKYDPTNLFRLNQNIKPTG